MKNLRQFLGRTPPAARDASDEAPTEGHLDQLIGTMLFGWAIDIDAPHAPPIVDFRIDRRLVGSIRPETLRTDLPNRGPGSQIAGFRCALDIDPVADVGRTITARLRGNGRPLSGPPMVIGMPAPAAAWLARTSPPAGSAPRRKDAIAIIVPIDPATMMADIPALRVALQAQTNAAWTLHCILPDAEFASSVPVATDPRIYAGKTSLSAALADISSSHVIVMQPQARLEPEAVATFCMAIDRQDPNDEALSIAYADDLVTEPGTGRPLRFRNHPAFSHDLFLASPYFGPVVCIATTTLHRLALEQLRPGLAAITDLILRAIEISRTVTHIPAVLHTMPDHHADHAALRNIVAAHLRRIGRHADPIPASAPGILTFTRHDQQDRVLIVIPTHNRGDLVRQCLDSIRATTDPRDVHILVMNHDSDDPETLDYFSSIERDVTIISYSGAFNFAAINNAGVRKVIDRHGHILFLNNDIEAITPGWLERMRSLCARPDVGVVGATLLFADGRIQHSGVIAGLYGIADHGHKFMPFKRDGARTRGYDDALVAPRNYSAVTGACMMVRREVFLGVGGFDETLPVDYNDLDLCLRIGSLGLHVLLETDAVLIHHESASRTAAAHPSLPRARALMETRWADILATGDPFYNPLLATDSVDHSLGNLMVPPVPRTRRLWPDIAVLATATPAAIDALRRASLPAT